MSLGHAILLGNSTSQVTGIRGNIHLPYECIFVYADSHSCQWDMAMLLVSKLSLCNIFLPLLTKLVRFRGKYHVYLRHCIGSV